MEDIVKEVADAISKGTDKFNANSDFMFESRQVKEEEKKATDEGCTIEYQSVI